VSSMLSSRGGPQAHVAVGHLTLIAFPTLRNLTKRLQGRGCLIFKRGGMEANHIIRCAHLYSHLEIILVENNTGA